ncbi:MAG: PRC-barrel domain-containing protein [Methanoculleus sp.]|nr:PRC-barrel domain-containing protein [Methanoculleus sp.]
MQMRGATTEMGTRSIVRGKDLADYSVRNPRGEDLGTIKDIVIDTGEGCIAYAALSFGGIMGLGDKLFAVPWEALRYNATDDSFVLDVPKERLENAPGFDKDNWPTTAEREWLTGMYSHYGYAPYWERRQER